MSFPVSNAFLTMNKLLFALALIVLTAFYGSAQEQDTVLRPVLSAYSLEAGSNHLCNTYLTPLHYSGWRAALSYERMQAMKFNPERFVQQLNLRFWAGSADNPARTASMWQIGMRPSWSMMWRKSLHAGFTVGAGGTASADIGMLYLMRNGNNPVAVQASATIGATAMAVWNGRIGRLPLTLRYQPTMPLVGAFFSPDYDELYYEIWLGNHSGLAHCAWPGNFFRLDNLLTADFHFGATTLRLGYRCEIFSSKASGIVSRDISHLFVLGVTTEWLSLRAGSRRTPDARIISALY